jgi:hypothetical protein
MTEAWPIINRSSRTRSNSKMHDSSRTEASGLLVCEYDSRLTAQIVI